MEEKNIAQNILDVAQELIGIPCGKTKMPTYPADYLVKAVELDENLTTLLWTLTGPLEESQREEVTEAVAEAFGVFALIREYTCGIKPAYATFFVRQLGEEGANARLNQLWEGHCGGTLVICEAPNIIGQTVWVAYEMEHKEEYGDLFGVDI